jgi:hypothetical protein
VSISVRFVCAAAYGPNDLTFSSQTPSWVSIELAHYSVSRMRMDLRISYVMTLNQSR